MLFLFRTHAFRRLVDIQRIGWIAVALSSVALATTTASLMMTSAAHVTVIYATCPFIAAIIARLWLGEKIPRTTLVAILMSMLGVIVVISGSTGASTLLGDAMALLMTISFAAIIVMSKAYPSLKIVEVTILSAFLTFGLFLPFASSANLDQLNVMLVSTYGLVNLVLAFLLFIKGARHIPAATSGLIVTLEIVLSPFWVWLAFGEVADSATLLGAAIVAVAVVGHLLLSFISGSRTARTIEFVSFGSDGLGERI